MEATSAEIGQMVQVDVTKTAKKKEIDNRKCYVGGYCAEIMMSWDWIIIPENLAFFSTQEF